MAYPPLVRQDGFQLPSPAHTASPKSTPDDERDDQLFMPHNISFLPDSLRRFPAQAHAHPPAQNHPIDFADELATLIEPPHVSSHERSTHSRSPNDDTYRHNIFDISAPQQQEIYHHDYTHFNSPLPATIRYEPHADPSFQYRHSPSPTHRSRSRSRPPSVGPTRPARRDRRANSISSHVSSTSPPPRPHPHAIVIPGRGNTMGGFFVPNGTSAPPDYNLPTPDSLSHSFGIQHAHAHAHSQHSQFPYSAQTPSSPYYPYPPVNRPGTPNMGISPTDVEALNNISLNGMTAHHLASSLPAPHLAGLPKSAAASSTTKSLDPDVHLSEKRRRRRESHNAVERRRRDNINERIGELAGLIPGVLFECDGPLVVPGTTPPASSATGPNLSEDLFTMGVLDSVLHVLPMEDGLPDLPEEGSMVKKDPSEEGELAPTSPTSPSGPNVPVNGSNEQMTIKANKGMILRKSVEYIRYLQQLVSMQASRGRDLEERNRALESELAVLRGDTSALSSAASSASPSVASSVVLSVASTNTSVSAGAPGCPKLPLAESSRERRGDLEVEMEDAEASVSEGEGEGELRGRRLGRVRDKVPTQGHVHGHAHAHALGMGLGMMEM